MPLPTLDAPTYNLTLPDSKKKIKYRPFRVKEEKVMMIAAESGDINTIYQAVHDIVLTCTNGKLNIFQESSIDSEYALIKLRASSVGETMKPNLLCAHCNHACPVKIKADDLIIDSEGSKENKIKVDKKMIIELKYPSFAEEIKNSGIKDQIDLVFDSVCCAIDKIYYEDEVFDAKEYKQDEIQEFVDALDASVFSEIIEFINTKPRVKIPVKFMCPKCEKENDMKVEGMDGFFA